MSRNWEPQIEEGQLEEKLESTQPQGKLESTQPQGFLETGFPDVSDKTPEEVERLLNKMASEITVEQIEYQNDILDDDVAKMKQFMDKAVTEGVIVDDTDENEEDGTILLKDKSGQYNPIGDLIAKKRADLDAKLNLLEGNKNDEKFEDSFSSSTSLSRESVVAPAGANVDGPITFSQSNTALKSTEATPDAKFTPLKPVVVHIPISGEISSNEVLRYASAAIQDCYLHGEAPICPLLQTTISMGVGKITDQVRTTTIQTMVSIRQVVRELRVYIDCDTKKEFEGTFTNSTVVRSLNSKVQAELEKQQSGLLGQNETVDEEGNPLPVEPAPDKTSVNRYTRDADGKPVKEFPPGVAAIAADGTPIPIDNSGKSFNPRIPKVHSDMEYRNALLATPAYDPKDWYYKRFDKNRYLVVAYMGPKNCNLKYEDYFMCVFAAVRSKSECAAVIEHVRKTKNCYHGKLFNIGVVEIGEWFATAPPRFAKDATASYSNPLHREYMDAYINEQKRITVETEKRVLDDEVRARQKTNTMIEQLKQKGMNPDLAPSSQQVQVDIEQQRQENAKQAMQHKRLAAEAARRRTIEESQRTQTERTQARGPVGPQAIDDRPAGMSETQRPATLAGGMRRPPRMPVNARGRGRGRGAGPPAGVARRTAAPQGTAIDI